MFRNNQITQKACKISISVQRDTVQSAFTVLRLKGKFEKHAINHRSNCLRRHNLDVNYRFQLSKESKVPRALQNVNPAQESTVSVAYTLYPLYSTLSSSNHPFWSSVYNPFAKLGRQNV